MLDFMKITILLTGTILAMPGLFSYELLQTATVSALMPL